VKRRRTGDKCPYCREEDCGDRRGPIGRVGEGEVAKQLVEDERAGSGYLGGCGALRNRP
jgi:hypothetical protein